MASENGIYVRWYRSIVQSGMSKALGKERMFLLLHLAFYMDKDGVCYPTPKQLAEDMGLHEDTVKKYVKSLRNFRWYGKPIIEITSHKNNGRWEKNVYRILPMAQVAIFDGVIQSVSGMTNDHPSQEGSNSQGEDYTPTEVTDDHTGRGTDDHTNYIHQTRSNKQEKDNAIVEEKNSKKNDGQKNIEGQRDSEVSTATVYPDCVILFLEKYREKFGREYEIKKEEVASFLSVALQFGERIDEIVIRYIDREQRPSLGWLAILLMAEGCGYL